MSNISSQRVALKFHCQNLALVKKSSNRFRDEEQSDPSRAKRKVESNGNCPDIAGDAQRPVAVNLPHHDVQDLLRHAIVAEADDIATDSIDLLEGLDFSQSSKALRTHINHKLLDFSKPCCDQVMNTIARLTRKLPKLKLV